MVVASGAAEEAGSWDVPETLAIRGQAFRALGNRRDTTSFAFTARSAFPSAPQPPPRPPALRLPRSTAPTAPGQQAASVGALHRSRLLHRPLGHWVERTQRSRGATPPCTAASKRCAQLLTPQACTLHARACAAPSHLPAALTSRSSVGAGPVSHTKAQLNVYSTALPSSPDATSRSLLASRQRTAARLAPSANNVRPACTRADRRASNVLHPIPCGYNSCADADARQRVPSTRVPQASQQPSRAFTDTYPDVNEVNGAVAAAHDRHAACSARLRPYVPVLHAAYALSHQGGRQAACARTSPSLPAAVML
jgi:hypothetical protein